MSDEMPEETGWCMPSLGASAFVALIIAVRSVPVFVAGRFDHGAARNEPPFTVRERTRLALYAGTGLPGTGPVGPAEATDRATTSDDKPRS